MRALFRSINLIGDGLYVSRALLTWHHLHPEFEIDLFTLQDHITCIYSRMGVPLNVITSEESLAPHYDFEFTFDAGKAFLLCRDKEMHIAEGYAQLLGIQLQRLPKQGHLRPIFIPVLETLHEDEKNLILVSMFSASCESRIGLPPNKMLPWPKWIPILEMLQKRFPHNAIRFLGGPQDRAPETVGILEEEYMTGIPLNRLAQIMAVAKLVFTIDNGMGHLASSQRAREIVLYPSCLGLYYIVPYGNPNLGVIQVNPVSDDVQTIIDNSVTILEQWGM